MKILTLSNCPLVESQGSGYVIINFCRGLRHLGHEVDLFGPEDFEPFPGLGGMARSYRQALGMLPFVLMQIARKQYDILEFYGGEAWLTIALLSKLPRRDFLMVSHSNGLETQYFETLIRYSQLGYLENPYRKWYQFNQVTLFKKAFDQVDAIITVSNNDAKYALNHHYQVPSRIASIDNSLPDTFLGLPVNFAREPVIGFCGSWLPRKGIKAIVADMSRLLQDYPTYRLKLIGVGDGFAKADYFAASVIGQIDLLPSVDRQQLIDIYQTLSILILPSFYESFGLVLAEAMACGCAVVASRVGFAASLTHSEEALIIDPPIPPQLYEAVKQLILDEDLRLKLAKAGYQRVQNLRWPSAISRLEDLYSNWLMEIRSN